MNRHLARRVALATLLAGLVSGCTVVAPRLERPTLAVLAVELVHAKALEQELHVHVRVVNPNAIALPVKSLEFRMNLAGEDIGSGASEAPFTVPAHGTAEFVADVRVDLVTVLGTILPRLRRAGGEAVDYRIVGTVRSDLPFFGTLAFDQKGSFGLGRELP